MRNQFNLKPVVFLITFFFVVLICLEVLAAPLAFKDNKGAIVSRGQDFIVRMVDTPGSSIKTAEALFLVKASPDAVYKVITDYEHYPEFMPNIVKADRFEKSDTVSKCRFSLKIALLTIDYSISLKNDVNKLPYSVAWNFIEGDIKDTSGSWTIDREGKEGRTSLVLYSVHTEPGRFVPDWIANKLGSESIPDMIVAIRKRAEN
jgi:ribosome-associated toxin RatA of RatAB toxin-antitoxin module